MEAGTVLALGREMLLMTLYLSVPIMVVGMAIGLIISIFQAMTQIQEQTLTFVPKIIGILVAILLLLPWSLQLMVDYTQRLIEQMPGFVN
ncbi:MAG: flagellar biosynthesis protein FliQ [Candidatus Omnitrophica bacterium]|nr:flagellar biosynthesis protein FliQ [Candidatus Omnitrophota bacterium]MCA9423512.1 flagellar biosynthesis protein FliQ [Candidatus Omnitrophota bacterium]MCA9429354.1 flagellar biosynthesis protein FliQ [Candidatus Omnitrophota bacterium]MCA9434609.1 flagellar biosynthesis protein FliQ [Candidatus Omnitrophota bacterium]MCB9768158.1 flagellar biosynthesis protein FliQ [Candidatus Omnitrophota bacterium]